MRRFVVAVVEAIVMVALIGALQRGLTAYGAFPAVVDFRVVYCGERAVLSHEDPYLTEPLRSCENAVQPSKDLANWAVTPYPLPGYSAAMLAPFALLPYRPAKYVWLGTLVLAFGITAAAIASIVRTRAWIVAAIFSPTLAFLDFYYGEPVNISVAAIALAALALERGRPRAAAVAAAVAMIEPHVGLPACVGLFVLVPQARAVLAAMAAALGAASLATVGARTTAEYFTTFLPLHARSEIAAADQYSLSHALFLAGVRPSTAILCGDLCYVVMIAFGVFAAYRVTKIALPRALVVLLPVAAAMLGGPFVHDVEIAAALPAAVVLATRSAVARAAVSLLAVQWGLWWRGLIVLVTASALGLASIALPDAKLSRRIAYAFGMTAFVLVLDVMLMRPAPAPYVANVPPVPITAQTPASIPWQLSIELSPLASNASKAAAAIKLPSWIALAIVPLSLLELQLLAAPGRSRREENALARS